MKRKLLLFFVICICFITCACGNEEVNKEIPQNLEKYSVEVNVECQENKLFSRYDVKFLVDNEKIGTIEHGGKETFNIELEKGEHIISFEKEEKSSVDGTVKINVLDNMAVRYNISCFKDQIKIEEKEVIENTLVQTETEKAEETEESEETDEKEESSENKETDSEETSKNEEEKESVLTETQAKIPENSTSYISLKYEKVLESLNNAGFTNIKTKSVYDVGTGWLDSSSKGNVSTVSVNGKNVFAAGEIFEKNCEIIITYHEYEILDPSIEYNSYTVAKLMSELEANAMNAKDTHLNEFVEISGRVESIDANGKNFFLYPSNDQWAIQGVLCDIQTDDQKEKLKNYSSGNIIKVKGKIKRVGEFLGYSMDVYVMP